MIEQQKKLELYEHDVDFAHIVALRLNRLIDDRVLTVEDVARAPHHILDEFLYFFGDQFINTNFPDIDDENKIKRFFRGEPVDIATLKERGPVGQQYVAMMKEILMAVKSNFPNMIGLLLYGSRMGVTTQTVKAIVILTLFLRKNHACFHYYLKSAMRYVKNMTFQSMVLLCMQE